LFDLNIRHVEWSALGTPMRIRFRCGCWLTSIGPGLVMRSCCRTHVPDEPDGQVTLGALAGGPWPIDLGLRMRLMPAGIPRDVAGDLALAGDPEWQAAQRAEQAAAEALRKEAEARLAGQARPCDIARELAPPPSSESQTRWYQLEALRRRIRAAAWRFFDNFQA